MRLYFLPLLGLFTSCNAISKGNYSTSDSAYKAEILSLRDQKDRDFALSPRSPFAGLEEDFNGLKYFQVNPTWNLKVTLVQPDTVFIRRIPDTQGGLRAYIYSGSLHFEIAGKSYSQPVWRDSADESVLFFMFRDATNADSTYGGGRYIETAWPDNFDDFTLDFNRCFNPYCHYNHDYSCPVVPKEFFLPVRIEAGEKRYH